MQSEGISSAGSWDIFRGKLQWVDKKQPATDQKIKSVSVVKVNGKLTANTEDLQASRNYLNTHHFKSDAHRRGKAVTFEINGKNFTVEVAPNTSTRPLPIPNDKGSQRQRAPSTPEETSPRSEEKDESEVALDLQKQLKDIPEASRFTVAPPEHTAPLNPKQKAEMLAKNQVRPPPPKNPPRDVQFEQPLLVTKTRVEYLKGRLEEIEKKLQDSDTIGIKQSFRKMAQEVSEEESKILSAESFLKSAMQALDEANLQVKSMTKGSKMPPNIRDLEFTRDHARKSLDDALQSSKQKFNAIERSIDEKMTILELEKVAEQRKPRTRGLPTPSRPRGSTNK